MAGITVDTSAFVAAMKQRLTHIGDQTRGGVKSFGEQAKDAAKRHIHSVSGDLAGRLKVDDHLHEAKPYLAVFVDESGDEEPHAAYHEYGTFKDAPHPFMRPAVEEARQDFHVEP